MQLIIRDLIYRSPLKIYQMSNSRAGLCAGAAKRRAWPATGGPRRRLPEALRRAERTGGAGCGAALRAWRKMGAALRANGRRGRPLSPVSGRWAGRCGGWGGAYTYILYRERTPCGPGGRHRGERRAAGRLRSDSRTKHGDRDRNYGDRPRSDGP